MFGPFEVVGGTQRGPWEERSLGKGGAEGAPTRLFPGTNLRCEEPCLGKLQADQVHEWNIQRRGHWWREGWWGEQQR